MVSSFVSSMSSKLNPSSGRPNESAEIVHEKFCLTAGAKLTVKVIDFDLSLIISGQGDDAQCTPNRSMSKSVWP